MNYSEEGVVSYDAIQAPRLYPEPQYLACAYSDADG